MTIAINESTQSFTKSRNGLGPGEAGRGARRDLHPLPENVTKNLVGLFKLLADETRLRILFLLQQKRELHVRALCQLLKQSQPAVSHHLALLRVAGMIDMRRDGKHNFYRITPQRFEELMGMVFAVSPGEDNQIRFSDYVLSYSHAER
jgi:ArsR family transcriptional regulator